MDIVLQNTIDTIITIKSIAKYFTMWSRWEKVFNGIESLFNHLLRVSVVFTVKLLKMKIWVESRGSICTDALSGEHGVYPLRNDPEFSNQLETQLIDRLDISTDPDPDATLA